MDISNAAIGSRIREIREIKGYTREQLAEYAEISANFLWEVETGRKSMKVHNLGKLAAALNISTDYLIFGAKQDNPNERFDLLSALPEDIQIQLDKIITAFLDTVRICKNKDSENDGKLDSEFDSENNDEDNSSEKE